MEKTRDAPSPGQKSLPEPSRSKSCDTACSSNSSCFFRKRKPINPLAGSLIHMNTSRRSTGNGVKQRVLSAKVLKLKSVQNQLNDANHHLAELMRENQALKTLQKRQDKALSKYEGTNADLPRLLKSHEEEIRSLNERNKLLRRTIRELNDQIKQKSDELSTSQTKLKHLEKLDKDKNLTEREKLNEQLQDCKELLRKADSEIVILNRKLVLEEKSAKQRLNSEVIKHKQCQRELTQALMEIEKLSKLLESRENTNKNSGADGDKSKRFSLPHRQIVSMISMNAKSAKDDLVSNSEKLPVTEVKLEPIIKSAKSEINFNNNNNNNNHKDEISILTAPSENIKARLSSSKEIEELPQVRRSRPNSSLKLEKLAQNVENTMKKAENESAEQRLGDYCLQAISSVNNCNDAIENHREEIENAKSDTNELVATLKELDEMDLRLKHSHLISFDASDLNQGENLDYVSQILNEELAFKRKYATDKNGNVKNRESSALSTSSSSTSVVGITEKNKLLATLRAIDNGDSVDSIDSLPQRKSKLMQELFGDVD